jgi:hypothetical protein
MELAGFNPTEYASTFQDLEMFGNGCRRESEGLRQLRDRAIRSRDLKQDSSAGSISQRMEYAI